MSFLARYKIHNSGSSNLLNVVLQRKPEQRSNVMFFSRRKFSSSAPPSGGGKYTTSSRNLSSMIAEEEDDDRSHKYHDDNQNSTKIMKSPLDITTKEQQEAVNDEISPSHLCYVADSIMPITSSLHIVRPEEDTPRGIWPVYRMMDENGEFRSDGIDHNSSTSSNEDNSNPNNEHPLSKLKSSLLSHHPQHASVIENSELFHPSNKPFPDLLEVSSSSDKEDEEEHYSTNTLLRAHRQIIRLREMDNILQNAQRQGRISFYLTCRGEEAIHIGSASALKIQDVVLAQYREAGILMWRGFTLEQFTNQCFSNDLDLGYGRQMPIHYGSRLLNYHTVSSPLGTQLPQAVGVAYKMKLDAAASPPEDESKKAVAIAYFGDGCASTTDFHSACNFAATLKTPVIFFCRNNGYAISTSIKDQYAGDGIVSRAPGYGMAGIRVDGNDLFAVHAATKAAREYAIRHSVPVFIEAITYRQGHHSTSDDSTQYRPADEVLESEKNSDPLKRLNAFFNNQQIMTDDEITQVVDAERSAVLKAMELAERRPPPKMESMFEDVYHEMPAHLQIQERNLKEHLSKNVGKY